MANRNHNRSDSYQYLFCEISLSNQTLTEISDMQGLTGRLNAIQYNEEMAELKDQFKKAFWRLSKQLTPRQQEVLKLSAKGLTQCSIANMLGINQSSITKSINGNIDYSKHGKKIYGGCKKKMLKIIETDKKFQEILTKMAELNELMDKS